MPEYTIHFTGSIALDAMLFFDDHPENTHPDATEDECAEQVRLYIEEHGLAGFLSDWRLEDCVTVSVGNTVAA